MSATFVESFDESFEEKKEEVVQEVVQESPLEAIQETPETTPEDPETTPETPVVQEEAVPQMEQQQQMEQAEEAQKEVEKAEETEEKKDETAVEKMEEVQLDAQTETDPDAIAEVVVVEEKKKTGAKLFGADGRAARFYRSVRSRIGKSKTEKKEAKEETMDTVVEEKTEETVEEKKEETEEKVEEEKKEEVVEEKKEEPKVTRRGTFYASVRARLARNKKTAEDKKATTAADTVVEYTVATGEVTVPAESTVADADAVPEGAAPTVEDAVAKEVEAGEHDDKLDTTQDVHEKTALKTRFAQRIRGFFRKSTTATVTATPAADVTADATATPEVTA